MTDDMDSERYYEWIDERLRRGSPRTQCAEWTREMVQAFPELKRVRGHVELLNGRPAHWWCVAPSGEIIDPTISQFNGIIVAYHPHVEGDPEPVGKCLNCGAYVFAPRRSACSPDCDAELQAYYAR